MWYMTSRRRHQLSSTALSFAGIPVTPVTSVHDLGIYIGADLSMWTTPPSTTNGIVCTTNGIAVLCCSTKTVPDLPISTNGHIPDAGCHPDPFSMQLWQWCAARHPRLPDAPTTVGFECGYVADFSSETFCPYYRCSGQSPLATSVIAYSV